MITVITGAASGIGLALSKILMMTDRLVLSDKAVTHGSHGFMADVEIAGSLRALVRHATSFGPLSAWYHCAGQGINRQALDTTHEDIQDMISVNVLGTWHALQACLPQFQRHGRGRFVAISSALVGEPERSPHRTAYTASKAAMEIMLLNAHAEINKEFPDISIGFVRLPGVATNFSRNALHAAPGAVSTSAVLLTPEEAALRVLEVAV